MNTSIIYLASLIVVSLTIILIVRNFIINEQNRRVSEIRKLTSEKSLLMRLQAYERLVLFLERLNPENLMFRNLQKGADKPLLTQSRILKSIREEYDHNLSQQIYISSNAWALVKSAKEEVAKAVNMSITKVNPTSNSMEYMKIVLESFNELEKNPITMANEYIKQEVRKLY